jgi:hypothetical protein
MARHMRVLLKFMCITWMGYLHECIHVPCLHTHHGHLIDRRRNKLYYMLHLLDYTCIADTTYTSRVT